MGAIHSWISRGFEVNQRLIQVHEKDGSSVV
jgi:hypothetical protein